MSKLVKIAILAAVLVLGLSNVLLPYRVENLAIELRPEILTHLGPLPISNTLLTSGLTTLILLMFALLSRRHLVDVPPARSLQNAVEAAFEMLLAYMQRFAGENAIRFFPIIATLFLFVLVANWLSIFPGFGSIGFVNGGSPSGTFVTLLRGPTSDLNTTAALAIWSVASAQYFGAKSQPGLRYFARYIAIDRWVKFSRMLFHGQKPSVGLLLRGTLDVFIGVLEIFDELTKILSFSFRLFGNVFGGEVLLLVIAFLMPFLISIPFMMLELFTGFIQAFIFAILSTAFFARAVASHGEHHPSDTGTAELDAQPNI